MRGMVRHGVNQCLSKNPRERGQKRGSGEGVGPTMPAWPQSWLAAIDGADLRFE